MTTRTNFKDYECKVRLLLVGDSGVGKSSILVRFAKDDFQPSYIATIGLDYRCRSMRLDKYENPVRVQVWDTAGQERFRTLTKAYFKGADGILLTYDMTDQSSFNSVKYWAREIRAHARKGTRIYLLGNKFDRLDYREVTKKEAECLAEEIDARHYECSAKSGKGVLEAIEDMTEEVSEVVKSRERQLAKQQLINLHGGRQRKCPCTII